jgi:putative FmdB family regulatory protein
VPTYDFRCSSCGLEFEVKRGFSESAAEAPCPVDGAASTRLFSPPTLLISGSSGGASREPLGPPPAPGGGHGDDHGHGHSHGPGTHTH